MSVRVNLGYHEETESHIAKRGGWVGEGGSLIFLYHAGRHRDTVAHGELLPKI